MAIGVPVDGNKKYQSPLHYYLLNIYKGTWNEQDKRIVFKAMQKLSAGSRRSVFCMLVAGEASDMEKVARQREKEKAPSAGNTKRQSLKLLHTGFKAD